MEETPIKKYHTCETWLSEGKGSEIVNTDNGPFEHCLQPGETGFESGQLIHIWTKKEIAKVDLVREKMWNDRFEVILEKEIGELGRRIEANLDQNHFIQSALRDLRNIFDPNFCPKPEGEFQRKVGASLGTYRIEMLVEEDRPLKIFDQITNFSLWYIRAADMKIAKEEFKPFWQIGTAYWKFDNNAMMKVMVYKELYRWLSRYPNSDEKPADEPEFHHLRDIFNQPERMQEFLDFLQKVHPPITNEHGHFKLSKKEKRAIVVFFDVLFKKGHTKTNNGRYIAPLIKNVFLETISDRTFRNTPLSEKMQEYKKQFKALIN